VNQGGGNCVLFFVGGLSIAFVAVFWQYPAVLLLAGAGVVWLLMLVLAQANQPQKSDRAARAALAERERLEQVRMYELNRQATERVNSGAGRHRIPDIDHFGMAPQTRLTGSSRNQPRLGVSRPALDDPDVVDGEVTDISGLITG